MMFGSIFKMALQNWALLCLIFGVAFGRRQIYSKFDVKQLASEAPPSQKPALIINHVTEKHGYEAAQ